MYLSARVYLPGSAVLSNYLSVLGSRMLVENWAEIREMETVASVKRIGGSGHGLVSASQLSGLPFGCALRAMGGQKTTRVIRLANRSATLAQLQLLSNAHLSLIFKFAAINAQQIDQ